MSQAEELLNSLDETTGVEEHIVIGKDRHITVPKSLKRIAVQFDHNIETVTFDCPRYWDDHDMSAMNIYINYMRSDRVRGMFLAKNVTVDETDENIMHFDWTLSRNATLTKGKLVFLVCVKKVEDAEETIHWNSELCSECTVSEGLECEDFVEHAEQDIITDLLLRMDNILAANSTVLDTSLTESGLAADAAVVGEKLNDVIANISDTTDALEKETAKRISEDKVLSERINSIISLSAGSTTGDAELIDARISHDGVTYETAGEAIRMQVKGVNDSLVESVGRVWFAEGESTAKYLHIPTPFPVSSGDLIKVDVISIDPAGTFIVYGYDDSGSHTITNVEPGLFFACPSDYNELHVTFTYDSETTATYSVKLTVIKEGDLLWNERIQDDRLDDHDGKFDEHDSKLDKLDDLIIYYNEIDPNDITPNANVDSNTGELVLGSTTLDATGYIKLRKNTTYYVNHVYLANFNAFYDLNKQFVSNPDVVISNPDSEWRGTITVGNESLYFRASFATGESLKIYISRFFNDYYDYVQTPYDDHVKNIVRNEISGVKLDGKKILVIGDSISADYYGEYDKWVTNLINDGCFPSDINNDSVHATGFVATYNNEANDFITRLKAVEDPSSYDLVIVFGGINDYIQNVDLESSFIPAVDEFFDYLMSYFTQARLCVLSPLRTRYSQDQNEAGCTVDSYAEYLRTVAKSYCLPILNLTDESGFCPQNDAFNSMWTLIPEGYTVNDGVHPNAEYEKKYLAPMIWHFIEGLI